MPLKKLLLFTTALFFLSGIFLFTYLFEFEFLPGTPGYLHINKVEAKVVKKYNIGIITPLSSLGERGTAQRYKIAAEQLGWQGYVFKYRATLGHYRLPSLFIQKLNDIINFFYKTDFLIVLQPSYYPVLSAKIPKYLVLNNEINLALKTILLHTENSYKDDYKYIGNYQGYISVSPNKSWFNKEYLKNFTRKKDALNNFPKILIEGYPSTYATPFKHLDYKNLFYCGGNWDKLRSSAFYINFIKILEEKNYLNVYGPSKSWGFLNSAYKGFLPDNGYSIIDAIEQNGIALVLHSDYHNDNGIPSSRIFEAAGASAVIISDENAFVKKELGKCVYFIDFKQSAEKVAGQIDGYINYIRSHKSESEQKAKCAHEILQKKFTLEKLLLDLSEKHELSKER